MIEAQWVPLATALLTTVSALGGVVIANVMALKNKKQEFVEQRRVESLALKRAAGEAIYRAVREIPNTQSPLIRSSWQFLAGEIPPAKYQEVASKANTALAAIDMVGTRLAMEVHFPDLAGAPFFKEVARCMAFNTKIVEQIKAGKRDKEALTKEFATLEQDLGSSANQLSRELATALRQLS